MSEGRHARIAAKAAHQVAYDIETESVLSRELGDHHLAQFLGELAVVIHRKADDGGYFRSGTMRTQGTREGES